MFLGMFSNSPIVKSNSDDFNNNLTVFDLRDTKDNRIYILFIGSREWKDNLIIIQIATTFTQINAAYIIDIDDITMMDSEKIKRK